MNETANFLPQTPIEHPVLQGADLPERPLLQRCLWNGPCKLPLWACYAGECGLLGWPRAM